MNNPQSLENPTWEQGALNPTSSRGDETLEAPHLEPHFPSLFLPPDYPHHIQPKHRAHCHALGFLLGTPLGPAMALESFWCSSLAPPQQQQTPLQHRGSLSSAQTWSFALQGHPRRDPGCGDRGGCDGRMSHPHRDGANRTPQPLAGRRGAVSGRGTKENISLSSLIQELLQRD